MKNKNNISLKIVFFILNLLNKYNKVFITLLTLL